MKKLHNLNTNVKFLIFILGSSLLFLLLYFFLYFYTIRQENRAYKITQQQYNIEAASITLLNSKAITTNIINLTFWDEFDQFAKTKDLVWYKDNLESEFVTYDVDYIGVYDIQGHFITKTSKSKIRSQDFIPKQMLSRLYQSKVMRFYLQIPEGVVEVFAATIHPFRDPKKNKTKPSGYFFMVKLLDKNYCNEFNVFSNSKVNLVQLNHKNPTSDDFIYAEVVLKDYKNTDVGILSFTRPFNLNYRKTKEILISLIVASFLYIFVYFYYTRKWIYNPLKTITEILETGNENSITILKKEPGEFGYIGNLFQENNDQRKQLELSKEKAEESDKLKSAFLANLSHEIRTPMNAIVGFSDLLSEPSLCDKLREEYLKIIKNCGINLVSIIEDLIEMSKIDSKQIKPNYKSIDLNVYLKELYNTIKVTIPNDKELELFFIENKEISKINILADEIKLKQVIVNLISNAIKYSLKGQIVFSYQINEKEKNIVFTVKDTGLGIDERNLKVIFDRFRRIEDNFSPELGGLGLGLAISKAYVEMLGGTISATSQINVGSVFTFSIPLFYDQTCPIPIPIAKANRVNILPNQTILVAEDDNINYLLIKKILELKQFKVIRAINGQDAVDICKKNKDISLVFMDIKMPVLNGFEAFKIIHSFNSKLPIIAQTAYASVEDFDKIMDLGFSGYISKPIDKEKIFELINSLI